LYEEGQPMIELDGENYLDGDEASRLLGVKLSTLYTYVSRGILKSYKQGIKRQRLYKQAELEALLRLRPSDDPSPLSPPKQAEDDSSSNKKLTEIPLAEDWVPYT
jgi:excisionase family DNA binding protein